MLKINHLFSHQPSNFPLGLNKVDPTLHPSISLPLKFQHWSLAVKDRFKGTISLWITFGDKHAHFTPHQYMLPEKNKPKKTCSNVSLPTFLLMRQMKTGKIHFQSTSDTGGNLMAAMKALKIQTSICSYSLKRARESERVFLCFSADVKVKKGWS